MLKAKQVCNENKINIQVEILKLLTTLTSPKLFITNLLITIKVPVSLCYSPNYICEVNVVLRAARSPDLTYLSGLKNKSGM